VLLHQDEITICANPAGFKSLGLWMVWLADSKPEEYYHCHLLWHLESEASRFKGAKPKNVWFLRNPPSHRMKVAPPAEAQVVPFELTFQVVPERDLDELAAAQKSGLIPKKYRKREASYVAHCG
jgi:hypothetical protein